MRLPPTNILAGLLTIIVILAGVRGGIGGSLANRDKVNTDISLTAQSSPSSSLASSATGASSSTGIALPTSALQPPRSTITMVGPTATLLRECPSSNDTIYTVRLGSLEQQCRKLCSAAFLAIKSDSGNFIKQFTLSLDDCIGLCVQWNGNGYRSTSGLTQTCGMARWRNSLNDGSAGTCYGM